MPRVRFMTNQRIVAYLFLCLTVIIWGFSFLSTKVCLREIPPLTLGLYRFIVATIILFTMARMLHMPLTVARADWRSMIGAGLVGVTLYFLLENTGLLYVSASEGAIIVGTIPVWTLLTEVWILRRPLYWRQVAGIVLAVAGVVLVVPKDAQSFQLSGSLKGYLLMLATAFSWVLYCFLTKPLNARYSRLTIVFHQAFWGMLGFVPLILLWERDGIHVLTDHLVIANVAYLGIFCSALAYYFYVVALDKLGVTISAIFINLCPVVTVIGGYLWLGDRLSAWQLFGGSMVVMSVYLTSAGTMEDHEA